MDPRMRLMYEDVADVADVADADANADVDVAQIEAQSEHSGYEVDDDDGRYLGIVDMPNGPPRRGAPELSNLWVRSSTGRRICIPSYAVHKFGDLVGCLRRPPPCDCARGDMCPRNWPSVAWSHVTVLTAIDEEGLTVAGWFVRFPATPRSLVRIPSTVVDTISASAAVGSDAWQMADVSVLRPSVDFLTLAEARYAHLQFGALRLWRASKRAVAARSRRRRRRSRLCPRSGPSCAGERAAAGSTTASASSASRRARSSSPAAAASRPQPAASATSGCAACASCASATCSAPSSRARAAARPTSRSTTTAIHATRARRGCSAAAAIRRAPRAARATRGASERERGARARARVTCTSFLDWAPTEVRLLQLGAHHPPPDESVDADEDGKRDRDAERHPVRGSAFGRRVARGVDVEAHRRRAYARATAVGLRRARRRARPSSPTRARRHTRARRRRAAAAADFVARASRRQRVATRPPRWGRRSAPASCRPAHFPMRQRATAGRRREARAAAR